MVNFKQLLEKATNGDLSEPDWETILEIVEEVKTKNVSAKNAMKDFRKRLLDNSGNVVYHTLLVLDSLMKNCASDVHSEVLSVEFLGVVKAVITSSKDGNSGKAVDKALELIGEWKAAFGEQTGYKAVNTVYSELEREGFHIPTAQVASAAFIKKAPEWIMNDRCFMCRQEFNRFKGKLRHHCRNCGKSVCGQCSGKRVSLPHFGVDEPTRVCDICYKKVEKGEGASAATSAAEMDNDLPVEYLRSSLAQESQGPSSAPSGQGQGQGGSEQQYQEDDDLQLAIAISLNEQENKTKKASPAPVAHHAHSPSSTPRSATPSAPPRAPSTLYASIIHDQPTEPSPSYSHHQPPPPQSQPSPESSGDPLAHYLDRNYWEQRKEQQASGIPPPLPTSTVPSREGGPQPVVVGQAAVVAGPSGSPLAESIRNSIDMFVKRLHEVNSSGGSIATDPVVLSLYQNLTAMQPQLLKQVDDIQQQKAKQIAIINKLNEAKEARVTLNKMRRDHQDKVKQMEQEQSMLARMQMEQKLALLRQQKQEQLAFQQTLQHKRLEVLNSQKLEYEQKVAMQREMERQHLIAQEQKVLQHQFGGGQQKQAQYGGSPQALRKPQTTPAPAPAMGQQYSFQAEVPPPGPPLTLDPASLPLHSMSLHDPTQALPLPPKLDYSTPGIDPIAPPPYNPSATPLGLPQDLPPASMYTSYQALPPPTSQQPPISLQGVYGVHNTFDSTLTQPPGHTLSAAGQLNSLQPANLGSNYTYQQYQDPGHAPSIQPTPLSVAPGHQQYQDPGVAQYQDSGHAPQPTPFSVAPGHQQYQDPGHVPSTQPPPLSVAPGHQQYQDPGHAQPPPPSVAPGQQQYQDPGVAQYQDSGHAPSTQPYTSGYQAQYSQQQQQQQQQQQTAGSFVPNGAHQGGLQRRESEPPLISFD